MFIVIACWIILMGKNTLTNGSDVRWAVIEERLCDNNSYLPKSATVHTSFKSKFWAPLLLIFHILTLGCELCQAICQFALNLAVITRAATQFVFHFFFRAMLFEQIITREFLVIKNQRAWVSNLRVAETNFDNLKIDRLIVTQRGKANSFSRNYNLLTSQQMYPRICAPSEKRESTISNRRAGGKYQFDMGW